jgi:glycosyltransferase involved in cell wall biosynthesis
MEDLPPLSGPPPLVSIVIPSYNHERYVEEAIRSACSQTYANLELIVIDDGSRDGSVDRIRSALADATCPVQFVARENRGAHVTINEGIELAQGKYIGILNSDDRYPAHRIDCMVRMLEAFDKQWGFAGVRFIDAEGALLEYGQHRTADICMKGLDRLYSDNSITLGFADFNYSISTGNLFFTKSLGKRLGGFRDFRYVHDWDFCLRALEVESPVFLHEPAYDYRLHGANTVREGRERIAEDRERMLVGWGQGGGDGTDTDHPRASLIACARERAFITANQGHLIEHGRLVTLAKALYAKTRSAGQPA